MFHALELEFIYSLHRFRTPLLDQLFKLLDFFDRQEFFFILIPVVWLGHGWKTGLRLFYILFLSSLTNYVLKAYFLSPRPFHIDPSLGIIQVSGFGFPSGAAQTVVLLSGLLLAVWKSSWKWLLVLTYILLVSFSRVYLGIHFPSDILGGWLVGLGLLALYIYIRPFIERQLEKLKPLSLFLLSQVVPILALIGCYSVSTMRACSAAMGIGIGLFMMHSYSLSLLPPKNMKEYALRAILGIVATFIGYALTLLLPTSDAIVYTFLQFLLLGLWVSLGNHFVCHKLFATYKALGR